MSDKKQKQIDQVVDEQFYDIEKQSAEEKSYRYDVAKEMLTQRKILLN